MNVICSEHNVCMYNQSNQSTTRDRPAGAGGPGGRGLPGGGALPEPDYPRVRLHGRPGIYFMSFPSRCVGGGQRACVHRRRRLPPDTSIKPTPSNTPNTPGHHRPPGRGLAVGRGGVAGGGGAPPRLQVRRRARAARQRGQGTFVRLRVYVPRTWGPVCALCVCALPRVLYCASMLASNALIHARHPASTDLCGP